MCYMYDVMLTRVAVFCPLCIRWNVNLQVKPKVVKKAAKKEESSDDDSSSEEESSEEEVSAIFKKKFHDSVYFLFSNRWLLLYRRLGAVCDENFCVCRLLCCITRIM